MDIKQNHQYILSNENLIRYAKRDADYMKWKTNNNFLGL